MRKLMILILLIPVLIACSGDNTTTEPVTLRLMTHDSFDISEETINKFIEETGIDLEVFKAGDAGAMVNQAVLAKDDPLADVIYGIDNTFLSRALENDILTPYESPLLENLNQSLIVDNQFRAIPVNYGDVCLNYDRAWFVKNEIAHPENLDDLVDPTYKGLAVVENPATSSPGLAFLLATVAAYGEDGYLDYWQAMVENDVLVSDGWEEAYYGSFTAASDGDRPIVVSYASSPPAEVYFAETELTEAPTASVVADGSCFRQIEFTGILKGSDYEEEARQLVDFLLGRVFQEDIPLHMFVYPANETAELPDVFIQFSALPENPAAFNPDEIMAGRERWVQAWTDVVLRQ